MPRPLKNAVSMDLCESPKKIELKLSGVSFNGIDLRQDELTR